MLEIIIEALRRIQNPHFYRSELGFQGELLAELRTLIPAAGLPGDAIIEQEYQKRMVAHGINVRPDLIVHVPAPPCGVVTQNNFVAFELNHQAGPREVAEDFGNLDTLIAALGYPLAVFINVASRRTQAMHYRGPFPDRLHCFAVRTDVGGARIRRAFFDHGRWVEVDA